jgi:hypothetical protein
MSIAVQSRVSVATSAGSQRFYVRMAAACVAVAFVGFAPTYWIPIARGTLDVAPITHVHALFFYGWTLLFLRQTWLAANGEVGRHQALGVAGVALATGMCFVGVAAAVSSLRQGEAAGFGAAARAFSIVPLTAIPLFAALFAIALLNVRKLEVHKRLMLVATISLLQAAVGRWFLLFLAPPRPPGFTGPVSPPPVFVTVIPGLTVDLLIVAAMVHDRRTTGRVSPVYWIAGACVVAVQVLRVPISTTTAWTGVVDGLLRVFP